MLKKLYSIINKCNVPQVMQSNVFKSIAWPAFPKLVCVKKRHRITIYKYLQELHIFYHAENYTQMHYIVNYPAKKYYE